MCVWGVFDCSCCVFVMGLIVVYVRLWWVNLYTVRFIGNFLIFNF
jgi:hypothetical protein